MVAANTAEAPAADSRPAIVIRGGEIPVISRLQARNLYLTEGRSISAISEQTGIAEATLRAMASREGWTKERQKRYAASVAKQDARGDALLRQAEEAISARATAIASKALDVTESGLDQGDLDGAKQAQAASSALKNLVTSARVLQTQPGAAIDSAPTQFNIFFAAPVQARKSPEQVVEIEAKKITPADSQ